MGWTEADLAKKGYRPDGSRATVPRAAERLGALPVLDPFQVLCAASGLPVPETEYEFAHTNHRADYAWPCTLILEVEGGVWTGGRHTRPSGFVGDLRKYNLAACYGYRLVRVVPDDLLTADTIDLVRRALLA